MKSLAVPQKNPVDGVGLFVKFPARLTDLEQQLNAFSLTGLMIRGRCFLISISDGAIRSVLVTL